MQLYHFTSIYHLRGIAQYGLTVGDVPTDMDAVKGLVGVWLTTSPTPEGHGLSGSKADKTGFRLTVDVPEDRLLHKWTAWARSNVPARTLQMLATPEGFKMEEFYVYFGWIRPDAIKHVVEVRSGFVVQSWGTLIPEHISLPGVPYGRRHLWQRRMLKGVKAAAVRQARLTSGATSPDSRL